jgi:hypothetical protein
MAEQPNWKCSLLQQWKTIVGNLHSKVTLEKVLDDTLILGVYDSCWLQELYLLSPVLIKRINATLDQPRIKQVRFKQIAYSTQSATQSSPTRTSIAPKHSTLSPRERQALQHIADEELRAALKSFLMRCYREK